MSGISAKHGGISPGRFGCNGDLHVVFAILIRQKKFFGRPQFAVAHGPAESASFALRNLEILLDLENEVVKVKIRVGNSGKNGDKWPFRGPTLVRSTKSNDWHGSQAALRRLPGVGTQPLLHALPGPTNRSMLYSQPGSIDWPAKSPSNLRIAPTSETTNERSFPEPKGSNWMRRAESAFRKAGGIRRPVARRGTGRGPRPCRNLGRSHIGNLPEGDCARFRRNGDCGISIAAFQ